MAEFPSKITTETTSPASQQGTSRMSMLTAGLTVDLGFVRTVPAILLLVEIVLGLLVWALIADTPYHLYAAYGWVMFVSVTLWLLTIILFLMLLFKVQQRVSGVPWPIVLLIYFAVATVLYFTAFVANAATVDNYKYFRWIFNNLAAAAFFGIIVTLTYGASTFHAYMTWRGDVSNAATTTVPV
ncbi:plasmolipin [Denticeps clupeoides]|uniref:Plasmolipin n=1 Tax=Denticeps clupeoides TaxID=299321 RepID=A0AAY4DGY5_9TELE|nr:plasmolipin [Denticeps clupeoides]